ncbi:MAG TPA: hypothetical protein VFO57_12150 [Burkholderiales bacterium]|nr:hypothetical protein [Burkholderiales bacterium]
MPEGILGPGWAFGWGVAAASGALVGAIVGLVTALRHRAIAAIMSLGAGVLLSAASYKVASEALVLAGAASTTGGIITGAATFSIANAALIAAKDRKRCGECKAQPSEAEAPGSGTSIALGTALDAVPEALVLGASLRAGGPAVVHTITRERPPAGWRGHARRIDTPMLAEFGFPPASAPQVFVCGPTAMVEAVAEALVGLGHEPGRVKTEPFGATGGG